MRVTCVRFFLVGLVGLSAWACDPAADPLFTRAPAPGAELQVTARPGELELRNLDTLSVHTAVFGGTGSPLFLGCAGPGCPALAPGAVQVVPNSDVYGYSTTHRDAVVYWWHSVIGADGQWQGDSMRSVAVTLVP